MQFSAGKIVQGVEDQGGDDGPERGEGADARCYSDGDVAVHVYFRAKENNDRAGLGLYLSWNAFMTQR